MITNVVLPEQSNAADWIESLQLLAEDDGAPCWTTVPVDLVVTLNVIPEVVGATRDYGASLALPQAAVITATSIDGSGKVTAFDNGFIEISIDDSLMRALGPDRHGVAKRYLVFVKIATEGFTFQVLVGILPVTRGA